jgi:large subunit ribosomal protein LP0
LLNKEMPGAQALEKKQKYFAKLKTLVNENKKVLLVNCDNVGSAQLQTIRRNLGSKATILMGKNTLIRKCLREVEAEKPELSNLIPLIRGNLGLVFTNGDLSAIRKELEAVRQEAPAKIGAISPAPIIIPAGPTGMEPTQTSFLQALNIASKIVRGQVEIVSDVQIVGAGDRVTTSAAALLQKLSIKPFSYGLTVEIVYDSGSVFDVKILDIDDNVVLGAFFAGVNQVASVSLAIGYPTAASLPHTIVNGFKNILAIALETSYTFPAAEKVKEILKNPGAFAAAPAAGGAPAPAAAAAPAPEPEPESSSAAEDLGGGLFGGDDGC